MLDDWRSWSGELVLSVAASSGGSEQRPSPLLRGVGTLHNGKGVPANIEPSPTRRAEAEVAALVEAIERASASADPHAMASLLSRQNLKIGPTRVVNNRLSESLSYSDAGFDDEDKPEPVSQLAYL